MRKEQSLYNITYTEQRSHQKTQESTFGIAEILKTIHSFCIKVSPSTQITTSGISPHSRATSDRTQRCWGTIDSRMTDDRQTACIPSPGRPTDPFNFGPSKHGVNDKTHSSLKRRAERHDDRNPEGVEIIASVIQAPAWSLPKVLLTFSKNVLMLPEVEMWPRQRASAHRQRRESS